ncbi:putative sodium bile acid cotransporter [Macrophomina phaseolina]|uniref:Sodium bile acid cotransporter n=1 Tax=Macrophomina phaseolina TaxID=35725 RepID=A0ABQ8GV39_9PEZI|nr:putative sodium bile acid cotransporter [Macrophomina phaseolina]
MIIGIGVVCALGYCFPHIAAHGGTIRSEYSILYGAVAVIFLISGLSIAGAKLVVHAGNWRLHMLVQGSSFVLCPLTMWGFVAAIDAGDTGGKVDRVVLVGYLLTACIPTTIASNVVMTRAAGGDEAAALVEVLLGNVVGPAVSPAFTVALMPRTEGFAMWRDVSGDLSEMYRSVFRLLGLSVYVPLAVGQLVRWRWPDVTARTMQRFQLNKVGTFCLLLLIWSSFSTCFETSALQELSTQTVVLIVFFNIGIYLFWTIICFLLARIPDRKQLPSAFADRRRRLGLGIPLVYAMWTEYSTEVKARMSVPMILYTTEQVFCAHILVHAFKRWVRREKIRDDGVLVEAERGPEMTFATPITTEYPGA